MEEAGTRSGILNVLRLYSGYIKALLRLYSVTGSSPAIEILYITEI
jgi:hypothetical protein